MELETNNTAKWVDAYVLSAVCPSCYAVLSVYALRNGDNCCPFCGERIHQDDYVPALDRDRSFERAQEISAKMKAQKAQGMRA